MGGNSPHGRRVAAAPSLLWRRAEGGVSLVGNAVTSFLQGTRAESRMDVLFVAILAVPLILGKSMSLPGLLSQVF